MIVADLVKARQSKQDNNQTVVNITNRINSNLNKEDQAGLSKIKLNFFNSAYFWIRQTPVWAADLINYHTQNTSIQQLNQQLQKWSQLINLDCQQNFINEAFEIVLETEGNADLNQINLNFLLLKVSLQIEQNILTNQFSYQIANQIKLDNLEDSKPEKDFTAVERDLRLTMIIFYQNWQIIKDNYPKICEKTLVDLINSDEFYDFVTAKPTFSPTEKIKILGQTEISHQVLDDFEKFHSKQMLQQKQGNGSMDYLISPNDVYQIALKGLPNFLGFKIESDFYKRFSDFLASSETFACTGNFNFLARQALLRKFYHLWFENISQTIVKN